MSNKNLKSTKQKPIIVKKSSSFSYSLSKDEDEDEDEEEEILSPSTLTMKNLLQLQTDKKSNVKKVSSKKSPLITNKKSVKQNEDEFPIPDVEIQPSIPISQNDVLQNISPLTKEVSIVSNEKDSFTLVTKKSPVKSIRVSPKPSLSVSSRSSTGSSESSSTKIPYIRFDDIHSSPPFPSSSKAQSHLIKCSKIGPRIYFRRSGIIPYTFYNNEFVFFFNVFVGNDMDTGNTVLELSDFGGKVEKNETFITGAINETFEESLGLFNFLGQENEIASITQAIYSEDRSIIILLVPIIISQSPDELIEIFSNRRNNIADIDRNNVRSFLNINIPKKPRLDIEGTETIIDWMFGRKSIERKSIYNIKETKDILYISGENLLKLIDGELIKISRKITKHVRGTYTVYPFLYYIISDRLKETDAINELIENQ